MAGTEDEGREATGRPADATSTPQADRSTLRDLLRLRAAEDEAGFVAAYEPHVADDAAYRALLDMAKGDHGLGFGLRAWCRGLGGATFLADPATGDAVAQLSLFAVAFEPRADGAVPDAAAVGALLSRSRAFGAGSRVVVAGTATTAPWLSAATPGRLRAVVEAGLDALPDAIGGDAAEAEAARAALADLAAPSAWVGPDPGDPHAMLAPAALVGLRVLPLDGRCPCCGAPTDMLWGDPEAQHVLEARRRFEAAAADDRDLAPFRLGVPVPVPSATPTLAARAARRACAGAGPRATVHVLFARRDVLVGAGASGDAAAVGPASLPADVVGEDEDAFLAALGPMVEVHERYAPFMAAIGKGRAAGD